MTATVATHIRQRVLASGRRYWRTEELRAGVESAQAAHVAIHRLVKEGHLVRVRRGMYWHGASVSDGRVTTRRVRSPGTIARAAMPSGESVGPSGWQATNLLGLSTQVSPVEVIASTSRAPAPIPGVRFVNRTSRRGRREQRLNEVEVALLEALEGWKEFIELPSRDAIARIDKVLRRDDVRIESLVRASSSEPAPVRERLREVLLRTGRSDLALKIQRAVDPRTRERALSMFGQSR